MFGGLFGGPDGAAEPGGKERLQSAVGGVVEGFGSRDDRRPLDNGLAAAQAFETAGASRPTRKKVKKRTTDSQEVQDLLNMFGDRPAWDSTPMRNRPSALRGLKPITREPWAYDEAVYNRRFETRDLGTPDRYLDPTARVRHESNQSTSAANAFNSKFGSSGPQVTCTHMRVHAWARMGTHGHACRQSAATYLATY